MACNTTGKWSFWLRANFDDRFFIVNRLPSDFLRAASPLVNEMASFIIAL
jgi:hypothetical protein